MSESLEKDIDGCFSQTAFVESVSFSSSSVTLGDLRICVAVFHMDEEGVFFLQIATFSLEPSVAISSPTNSRAVPSASILQGSVASA